MGQLVSQTAITQAIQQENLDLREQILAVQAESAGQMSASSAELAELCLGHFRRLEKDWSAERAAHEKEAGKGFKRQGGELARLKAEVAELKAALKAGRRDVDDRLAEVEKRVLGLMDGGGQ